MTAITQYTKAGADAAFAPATAQNKGLLSIIAAAGAAQTFDSSVAAEYDVTLTANFTPTLVAGLAGVTNVITVWYRAGAGGFTVTQPGSVATLDGSPLTIADAPNAVTVVTYVSHDGGSSWLAWSSVSPLATVEDALALMSTGEETVPLYLAGGAAVPLTQELILCYMTARRTETIGQITVTGTSTVSSGLTLARMGVWPTDNTGALGNQLAATANDPSLLNTAQIPYDRGFTAPFTKRRGQRYAVGLLQVGATIGRPACIAYNGGFYVGGATHEIDRDYRRTAKITGQADLPISATAASLATTGYAIRFHLRP